MNLSPEDTELYYKLMWSLQYYINRQVGLLKEITTLEEYASLPSEEKLKVRKMLWDNPKLIDDCSSKEYKIFYSQRGHTAKVECYCIGCENNSFANI